MHVIITDVRGADRANVRSGPGLDHAVIASVTRGDLIVLAEDVKRSDGYAWGRILDGFGEGWVALDVLRTSAAEPEPLPPQVIVFHADDVRELATAMHQAVESLERVWRVLQAKADETTQKPPGSR